ncbi:ribonuclease H-like domain-containing protein [Tanacetum coccineum]
MRPFGCTVTILNTIDHLGKFDGKVDEGYIVGYSTNSKAFRVFNSRTRIVEENLHVQFSENTSNVAGSGPNWLFDIDALTNSMNYKPVVAGNQSNGNAGTKACDNAGKARMETVPGKDYILLPMWPADLLFSQNSKDSPDAGFKPSGEEEKMDTEDPGNENAASGKDSEVPSTEEPREDQRVNQELDASINSTNNINTASDGNNTNNVNVVSSTVNVAVTEVNVVDPKTSIELPNDPNMPELEDIVYSDDDEDVGAEADMNNLDAFMPVSPIPTTRIHKDHPVDQIIRDLNSAPQTRRMTKNLKEHEGIDYDEVFDHVARIEAIRLFLAYASFKDFVVYQMDVNSAFIYGKIEEEFYVCQPLGFKDPDFSDRVSERTDRQNFIYQEGPSQDKYVDEILKKFGFSTVKTASIPMETSKPLLKDAEAKDVDIHILNVDSSVKFLMYPRFVKVFLDKQVGDMSTHDEIFVIPSHTKKVFGNMKRVGKGFSGEVTPLFPTMMVQAQEEMGEEPIADEAANEENVPTQSNNPPLSRVNTLGSGEDRLKLKELMDLYTKLSDRVLDLEIIKTTQSKEITSLKKRVKKLERKRNSKTLRMKRLFKIGRSAQAVSSEDEGLGDQEDASKQGRKIDGIDKDVEVTLVDETHGRYDDAQMFNTDVFNGEEVFVAEQSEKVVEEVVSTAEVSAAATITTEEIILAKALAELRSAKPKVMVQEPFESTTRTTLTSIPSNIKDKGKFKMIEPEKPLKKKEKIRLNKELAFKLQAKEEEQARLAREKAKKVEKANISWDNVQAMIEADRLLAEKLQAREQEELTNEEKARLFVELLEKRKKHFAALRA